MSNKPHNNLCLIFLPNFLISFMILFFELNFGISLAGVSPISLHQKLAIGIDEGGFIMGKEGPGPRVRSSKGKRSLTLGSTLFSWVSLTGLFNWSDRTGPLFSVFRSLGPLLESLNSNLNLPLFTLCINDSMNESGDSSMQPFS